MGFEPFIAEKTLLHISIHAPMKGTTPSHNNETQLLCINICEQNNIDFSVKRTFFIEVKYGKRWIVEIYFSGLKRTMGEVIKATRPDNIAQEIAMKVV